MPSIKSHLKRSTIGRAASYAYDAYRFPGILDFRKRFLNLSKNDVILLGTPAYRNLGDHLIAVAEQNFLKNILPSGKLFEIPTHVFLRYKDFIQAHAPKDCLIIITGGGWMGNLWPRDEYNMQDMIRILRNNKILIMPQTVFYEDNDQKQTILSDAVDTYQRCEELYMTFRDRLSYEFAINNFGIQPDRIHLCPDIALSMPLMESNRKEKKGILLCMREDLEKNYNDDIYKLIKESELSNHTLIKKTSTITNHRIPIWKRVSAIERKIKEFSGAELVITDRLHGMIFAVLSGTPCIAIDNRTHKVKGVFEEWVRGQYCVEYLEHGSIDSDLIRRTYSSIKQNQCMNFKAQKNMIAFKEIEQLVRDLL